HATRVDYGVATHYRLDAALSERIQNPHCTAGAVAIVLAGTETPSHSASGVRDCTCAWSAAAGPFSALLSFSFVGWILHCNRSHSRCCLSQGRIMVAHRRTTRVVGTAGSSVCDLHYQRSGGYP